MVDVVDNVVVDDEKVQSEIAPTTSVDARLNSC